MQDIGSFFTKKSLSSDHDDTTETDMHMTKAESVICEQEATSTADDDTHTSRSGPEARPISDDVSNTHKSLQDASSNIDDGGFTSKQPLSSQPATATTEHVYRQHPTKNIKKMSTPDIGDKPHQPSSFPFPSRQFGKKSIKNRRFQAAWFDSWAWLHYLEDEDKAICFPCTKAYQLHLLRSSSLEPAFISTGYTNWKDATVKTAGFNAHERSECHKEAIERLITLPVTSKDVGECLSTSHEEEKAVARKNLLKIMSNLSFLARQNVALRGDGDEENSNFTQLVHLRAEDNPELLEWIKKKKDKYTSPMIQNEILRVMTLKVLREVAACIHRSTFFTIMAVETTDASNREQVVICIRWVDNGLEAHEEFIGLHEVSKIDAATITSVIKDVLVRMNLSLNRCRGQCYDGCSTMSGPRNGVATNIKKEEPRSLYTHCYGHATNLACADSIKKCKMISDALDTTYEITKLVKKSPKRDSQLEKMQKEMRDGHASNTMQSKHGIRLLCPTRWTVRAEAMESILENYQVLVDLWDWSLTNCSDTDMKARIRGVASHMMKFDFFFGLCLGQCMLRHADTLSATLQKEDMSAAEGQAVAAMTVKTLRSMRTDEQFQMFWNVTTKKADLCHVDQPKLPRRRRAPARLETGMAQPEFPNSIEDHYRQIYYGVLDLLTTCLEDRFDQKDYHMYVNCEQLLCKAAQGDDYTKELKEVTTFYGCDFQPARLEQHLVTFSSNYPRQPGSSPF